MFLLRLRGTRVPCATRIQRDRAGNLSSEQQCSAARWQRRRNGLADRRSRRPVLRLREDKTSLCMDTHPSATSTQRERDWAHGSEGASLPSGLTAPALRSARELETQPRRNRDKWSQTTRQPHGYRVIRPSPRCALRPRLSANGAAAAPRHPEASLSPPARAEGRADRVTLVPPEP
jgi:hypothetical protein